MFIYICFHRKKSTCKQIWLFTLYQFITTLLILVNSGNRGQKTPCKYNVHENCIEYCYAQKKTITVINKNINEPTIHEIQIWPPSNVYPYKHSWPKIYITSDVTILEYWKYRFFYYSWFNMQENTSIEVTSIYLLLLYIEVTSIYSLAC